MFWLDTEFYKLTQQIDKSNSVLNDFQNVSLILGLDLEKSVPLNHKNLKKKILTRSGVHEPGEKTNWATNGCITKHAKK